MSQRELIASAIRKLGPERCEQSLAAFDDPYTDQWSGCMLARAYGERGALCKHVGAYIIHFREAGDLLGLTEDEVTSVVAAFDDHGGSDYPVGRAELRQMVEVEASKARVTKREMAGAA